VVGGGWWVGGGGWGLVDGGWGVVGGGWWVVGSGWWVVDGGWFLKKISIGLFRLIHSQESSPDPSSVPFLG
jgi:hypothetical protein